MDSDDEEVNAEDEGGISDDFSSDDEIPLARLRPLAWKNNTFSSKDVPVSCTVPMPETKSPWEYFQAYLNDGFFQLGAE